jgi:transposase
VGAAADVGAGAGAAVADRAGLRGRRDEQAGPADLGVHAVTVGKWRARFVQAQLDWLADEPRPGAPRTVDDEAVEQVVVATLEQAPPDAATQWSTRAIARRSGLSQATVGRIWRAFGLKPHLEQTWKLSADPQFVDKVRDVVGPLPGPPALRVRLGKLI